MLSENVLHQTLSPFVLALLVVALTPLSVLAKGSLRYSVVVDRLDNKTRCSGLGNEWATQLTSALQESGHFVVVAQDDSQLSALKEQLRGRSGINPQGRRAAKRGRITPAQLIIQGVITNLRRSASNKDGGFGLKGLRIQTGRSTTEVRGTLQVIDVNNGTLVAAKNFVGTAKGRALSVRRNQGNGGNNFNLDEDENVFEALENAISGAIPWLVSELPSVPWRGAVVKVHGDQVIINRGSREGVATGDEFVAGESEILRDPGTGEFLEELINGRARIRIVRVHERTSTCSVVSGDAGSLVEGMGIQFSHGRI